MSEKVKEYWKCNRCKIDSTVKDRMCPCPRGGCEAELVGNMITTVKIHLYNDKQKPCNHIDKRYNEPYCKVFKGICKCK